jgi:hypothetical protein
MLEIADDAARRKSEDQGEIIESNDSVFEEVDAGLENSNHTTFTVYVTTEIQHQDLDAVGEEERFFQRYELLKRKMRRLTCMVSQLMGEHGSSGKTTKKFRKLCAKRDEYINELEQCHIWRDESGSFEDEWNRVLGKPA